MKLQHIDIGTYVTLGNGQTIFVPMVFTMESDTKNIDFKSLVNSSNIEFRTAYEVSTCGECYFVSNHPGTQFMGVKFAENSIYKVYSYDTKGLNIFYKDKSGKDESASISYGHLWKEEQEKVINNFFKDLGIKK